MDVNNYEKFIIDVWDRITSISRLERIEIKGSKKGEVNIFQLKTLDKIEFVLDNLDWDEIEMKKKDAIDLIILFHNVYNNTIIG